MTAWPDHHRPVISASGLQFHLVEAPVLRTVYEVGVAVDRVGQWSRQVGEGHGHQVGGVLNDGIPAEKFQTKNLQKRTQVRILPILA